MEIIFSLPVLTTESELNTTVMTLRYAMEEFVNSFIEWNPPQPLKHQKLWLNLNRNFIKDSDFIEEYYSHDGIHLSSEGKRIALANMRHHIHMMAKIENHTVSITRTR